MSIDTSICTHKGLWVPITTITNSKVVHFCRETTNIYIVSNGEKLARSNLNSILWVEALSGGQSTIEDLHFAHEI